MENKEGQMKQKTLTEIYNFWCEKQRCLGDLPKLICQAISSGELNDELAKLNYYFLDKKFKKRYTISIKER